MSYQSLLMEVNPMTHYLNRAHLLINIYNPEEEGNFDLWLNRFEYVADIIDVPNDRMIKFFAEMVDNDVHKCVKRAFPSENFLKLEFKKIINNYLLYFANSNENDLHKKRLFHRRQYEKETIQIYANNLRRISTYCKFINGLEMELCQLFLTGIRDDDLRKYLTKIPYFSLDYLLIKAVEFEKIDEITLYLSEALTMIDIYSKETSIPFYEWFNKFEYVAEFVEIPNKKMVYFFRNMVDDEFHVTLKTIFNYIDFSVNSYEEIINCYIIYFFSTVLINFHRQRFSCRKQYEKETIARYANNLRKILNQCFPNVAKKDNILWKKFVSGIRNQKSRIHFEKTEITSYSDKILSFGLAVNEVIEFEKPNEMSIYRNQALKIIKTYHPAKEGEFYKWLNELESVAYLVRVPNEKMIDFFEEMVEKDVSTFVQQTFPCINFIELSYESKINYYLRCFSLPSYEVDLHEARFMCREQFKRETIEYYAFQLWKIFNKCNHLNLNNKILCEQFVNGILDVDTKTKISKMSGSSFDKIVSIAISFEKDNLTSKYVNPALDFINIYDSIENGTFHDWFNRFEFVADFIHVPKYQILQFFSMLVDNKLHLVLRRSNPHVNFEILLYDEITYHYLRYFSPHDDVYEICFMCRKQFSEETVKQYADNLKKIFNKCNPLHFPKNKLKEQFINGIHCSYLKDRLGECNLLSFEKTVMKAVKLENQLMSKNSEKENSINYRTSKKKK